MPLKLYVDLMSQPCRALYILLKASKYEFETKRVDLRKGQHFSEEFTKVNRLQKVPVIDHDGFILTESVAIIKHFSRADIIPDSLYPKDYKQRARVDEFMEWQHVGLRMPAATFFLSKYLTPIVTGKPADPSRVAGYERSMRAAFKLFDTQWLGRGNDYLTGDRPTAADVIAACELEQPRMAGFNAKEEYANIAAWWQRVQDHFNPHYDDAHAILNKVIAKNIAAAAKQ